MAEQIKKGVRVTGPDRDSLSKDLMTRYSAGTSIRQLAAESGRSYGFVHRMLTEGGTALRGRGGATRTKRTA